jgi:hypothetical protein
VRVLVVDDHSETRAFLVRALGSAAHAVRSSLTAVSGLREILTGESEHERSVGHRCGRCRARFPSRGSPFDTHLPLKESREVGWERAARPQS